MRGVDACWIHLPLWLHLLLYRPRGKMFKGTLAVAAGAAAARAASCRKTAIDKFCFC